MKLFRLALSLSVIVPIYAATSPFLYFGETGSEQVAKNERDTNYRLFYETEPPIIITNYDVTIKPYFEGVNAFTFDGKVIITAKVGPANINTIKLHAKKLIFISGSYQEKGGNPVNIPKIDSIDDKYDFWRINTANDLEKEKEYIIELVYRGILDDDMHGFYKSYYMEGNVKKWIGTTQFQPVHARRAFPCYDEPQYKATFDITIQRPASFEPSLSNMKIEKTNDLLNGYIEEKFEKTLEMSAYLIAFVISEYVNTNNTVNGHGIWVRPEAKDQGQYAFETSQKIVNKFNEYLNYPLDSKIKYDHVAIPDFSAGAMENWGLATYREAYLMYDPKETSVRYKQQIAAILTHELAHFWFGDLVTCHWWSETWLNEGFARYFQYFLTDMVENMGMEIQFNVAQIHTVMAIDAAKNSLPLTNPNTNSPAEVQAQFGSVTYNKGASVIRMIRDWIGEDKFKAGLNKHMTDNAKKAVKEDDLFNALQSATELPAGEVKKVMSSWTNVNGFPLLKVDLNENTLKVTISQERFKRDGETIEDPEYIWQIPITYTINDTNMESVATKFLLTEKSKTIDDIVLKEPDWLIMNVKQTGYYRVHYDEKLWDRIVMVLKESPEKIHTLNRAQIVDDLFNLARENYTKYSTVLEYTSFLENEKDYAPWTAAYAGYAYLRGRFFSLSKTQDLLNNHLLTMMSKTLLTDIGLNANTADSHLKKMLRMTTLNLACQLGHNDCIKDSREKFMAFKNDATKSINPDLREHVYCNGLRHGNENDFDFLWRKFLGENVINEKLVIMNSLGCTTSTTKIQMVLYQTISQNSPIRAQDRMGAFNSLLNGNPANFEPIFAVVKENIQTIRETYGSGNLLTILGNIASKMSKEQLKDLEAILEVEQNYFSDDEKTSVIASVKSAEGVMKWAQEKNEDVFNWLDVKYGAASSIQISITLMIVTLLVLLLNNNQ